MRKKWLWLGILWVLLCACTPQTVPEEALDRAEYVVSLSRSMESGAVVLYLGPDGEAVGSCSVPGMSFNDLLRVENTLYLYSNRRNEHFALKSGMPLEAFQVRGEAYPGGEYDASWFAAVGEGTQIETMNLGYVDGAYWSVLLYDCNGPREMLLKNMLLNGAVDYDGQIFVEAALDDSDTNAHAVAVIHKETAAVEVVHFPGERTSVSGRLLAAQGCVFTYGDKIGCIDAQTLETRAVNFNRGQILLGYVYEERLHILSTDGNRYVYDADLKLVDTIVVEDSTILEAHLSGALFQDQILEDENVLRVLYVSAALENSLIGYIDEYDKSDLHLLRRIEIALPSVKEWMGEEVAMVHLG